MYESFQKKEESVIKKIQRLELYANMGICKFLKRKTTSSDDSVPSKAERTGMTKKQKKMDYVMTLFTC